MESDEKMTVALVLRRNFALGKDVRWFCRVLSCALALYRQDVASLLRREQQILNNPMIHQHLLLLRHCRHFYRNTFGRHSSV